MGLSMNQPVWGDGIYNEIYTHMAAAIIVGHVDGAHCEIAMTENGEIWSF